MSVKRRTSRKSGGELLMQYGCTVEELKELMEGRGMEGGQRLRDKYGDVSELCSRLHVLPSLGIKASQEDIQQRALTFGKNIIPSKPPKSFFRLIWDAFHDVILIILMIAAAISICISFYNFYTLPSHDEGESEASLESQLGWIEGAVILITVLLIVLVSACCDFAKERQFRKLKSKIDDDHKCSVLRDGTPAQILVRDLVVGDIVHIHYGDILPADGVIVQSNDLKIDESSLTGESDHVRKSEDGDPILLSGTYVMEGSGKMVVTAVGVHSQTGMIFALLGSTAEETRTTIEAPAEKIKPIPDSGRHSPDLSIEMIGDSGEKMVKEGETKSLNSKQKSILQGKLDRIAINISYVGCALTLVTITILFSRFCVDTFVFKALPWSMEYMQNFAKFITIGVTVLVVAIPEGLPLAVTLVLAYSVKSMMADKNLVRHLDACETMGNATTICSDKTGTLTTNTMTVVRSYIAGKLFTESPSFSDLPWETAELLVRAISINSGYSSRLAVSQTRLNCLRQIGNRTECALLGFVQELGLNYETYRKEICEDELYKVYTFNSIRKSMTTVVKHGGNTVFRLYTKGAVEIILEKCDHILVEGGERIELTDEYRRNILRDVVEPMQCEAMRVLCVAYRDINCEESGGHVIEPDWDNEDFIVSHLTCVAMFGIEDPVRPEVPEAIRVCQRAGIVVRMVTGDNINTARAIAARCGILTPGSDFLVLEGSEFNRLIRPYPGAKVSQELLDRIWPRLRVLARSSPQDKYNLVTGIIESRLTNHRQVVAVTGDGTNDGPALKRADVGFAMGLTGTDVAKEASDIIVTDDNFSSIVRAVLWGRNVYDCIQKLLQFQLTVNFVVVTGAFIAACASNDFPLKAIQILWVNLVMDTLAALALATEKPSDKLLHRKPYGRTEALVTRTMLRNIVGNAVYQLTVIFLLLFVGDRMFKIDSGRRTESELSSEPTQHFTMIFNSFVLMTLFNSINARRIGGRRNVFSGLHRSYQFLELMFVVTLGIQVLIVEFCGFAFSTVGLTFDQWLWCFVFGIGQLIWAQIVYSLPTGFVPSCLRMKGERHINEAEVLSLDRPGSEALASLTGRRESGRGLEDDDEDIV